MTKSTVNIGLGVFFLKLVCELQVDRLWRITDPGFLELTNESEVIEYDTNDNFFLISARSLIDLIAGKKIRFDWTDVEGDGASFEFIDSYWCDVSLDESLLRTLCERFSSVYFNELRELGEGINRPRGWRKHELEK